MGRRLVHYGWLQPSFNLAGARWYLPCCSCHWEGTARRTTAAAWRQVHQHQEKGGKAA